MRFCTGRDLSGTREVQICCLHVCPCPPQMELLGTRELELSLEALIVRTESPKLGFLSTVDHQAFSARFAVYLVW